LGSRQQKQFKFLFFLQPRSENVRNLPTKATGIDCILSSRAKVLEFANIVCTALCSAEQRKIWNLPTKATQIECILSRRAAQDF
jgi:hypothetical protein